MYFCPLSPVHSQTHVKCHYYYFLPLLVVLNLRRNSTASPLHDILSASFESDVDETDNDVEELMVRESENSQPRVKNVEFLRPLPPSGVTGRGYDQTKVADKSDRSDSYFKADKPRLLEKSEQSEKNRVPRYSQESPDKVPNNNNSSSGGKGVSFLLGSVCLLSLSVCG